MPVSIHYLYVIVRSCDIVSTPVRKQFYHCRRREHSKMMSLQECQSDLK